MEQRETLGFRIQRLRRAAGLTQEQFASQMEVPIHSLIHWEQDRRTPRIAALLKLAQALGVTVEDLVTGIAPPEKRPKPRRGRPPAAGAGDGGGDASQGDTEREVPRGKRRKPK
jgi:transcriptional regulator with XRE-family HTH domain